MSVKTRHLPIGIALLAIGVALAASGTIYARSAANGGVQPEASAHALAATATADEASSPMTDSPPAAAPPPAQVASAPAPGVFTLVAVGDVMLGRSVGQRVLSAGPEFVFDKKIQAVLKGADITVGNLECAVSERGDPQAKGYTFQAPPEALDSLRLAGFDVMSLANNHALDYGREALLDTVHHLSAYGIMATGAGSDIIQAQSARVLERAGLRIGFVGLVDVAAEGSGFSRGTWEAGANRPGVAWADIETVTASVKAAASSTDVVVVMLHFGVEYDTSPSISQRRLARAAIDAGAALVIGSHPHVLQEVEEYGGGLIAYSLGNFVFDGFDGPSNDSAILKVNLTRDGVASWKLLPVDVIDNGLPRLRPE